MIKSALCLVGALAGFCVTTTAQAAGGVPWRDHMPPFDFTFGNDLDTHQQSRQARDGSLSGFLYVSYTGVVTSDGLRVATHADCGLAPACRVGWTLSGLPVGATFLNHAMGDHPLFEVARADIPQPGSYAHFHWVGPDMPMAGQPPVDGYLIQLRAVSRFCFLHHGAEAATSAATCRDNGGLAVVPGIDIATHLNIVPSSPHGM